MAGGNPLPTDAVGAAFAKLLAAMHARTPLEGRYQPSGRWLGGGFVNWFLVLGSLLALALSTCALLDV
jgi:hypothetical protein